MNRKLKLIKVVKEGLLRSVNKRKTRGGYTLVELLTSLLLVSMSGLVIAGGFIISVNSYKQIVQRTMCNHLIAQYETAIRSTIENSETVFVSDNLGELIINNRNIGAFGYFDDETGIICFHTVLSDGEKYIDGIEQIDLCPGRQHIFFGEGDIESEISCSLKDKGQVEVSISVATADKSYSTEDCIIVWPIRKVVE